MIVINDNCRGCGAVDIAANWNSQQIIVMHDLGQCKQLFHTIEWPTPSGQLFRVYDQSLVILGQTAWFAVQQMSVGRNEAFFVTTLKEFTN